jgi:hypothetical protein
MDSCANRSSRIFLPDNGSREEAETLNKELDSLGTFFEERLASKMLNKMKILAEYFT